MKKILVPTDFSKASQNAYKYSLEIASVQNASIELVHVYSGNLNPTDSDITFSPSKTRQDNLDDQLTFFKDSVKDEISSNLLDIKIDCKSIRGFNPSSSISKISADYDLIVIGATGENDALKNIIGSTSSRVAQNSACPVIVIPKNITYQGLEKIVYASNKISAQTSTINKIAKLAVEFNARIDFVHINEDNDLENFSDTEEKILNSLFENKDCDFCFNVLSINDKSPLNGILGYSLKTGANLLVLVNAKSGLINNVLGFSLTNKMISDLEIPILVYHNDNIETNIASSHL